MSDTFHWGSSGLGVVVRCVYIPEASPVRDPEERIV